MGKSAWPTATDANAFLSTLGASAPGVDWATVIAAEVMGFEAETGYTPFLAGGTASRPYRAEGKTWLDLDGGWMSVSSLTLEGSALSDFSLEPGVAGRPGTWIRFGYRVEGAIVVTGVPGFALEIPEDAWQAVLDRAAARAIESSLGGPGQVTSLRQGALAIERASPSAAIEFLRARADRVVQRYRRPRL